MKTRLIFDDVPIHYELNTHEYPLMKKGDSIEYRNIRIKDGPKAYEIEGLYSITEVKLVHDSRDGFIQYLHLWPQF